MPRRKRKTKLRPKLPSRVKKTRTKRGAGARKQHPELWGLGAVALGLFLGAVLYLGWDGGKVGGSLGAILRRSGRGIHVAARKARTRRTRPEPGAWPEPQPMRTAPTLTPPVDAVSAFPDVVGERVPPPHAGAQPSPLQTEPPALLDEAPTLFDEVTSEHAVYKLPDAGVLRISPERDGESGESAARVAELLVQTLAHFGVEATVIGQISGPRVTRYELQLAPGTKVSKVAALKDDLSYSLATTEIRILAPIPGKQAVGVELPNLSPNLVTLGDIYDDLPATASPLSVWLGKDISGTAVWTDLARMPHLLIAGTTGAGKSGCINTMLTSVLLRSTSTSCSPRSGRPWTSSRG